MSAFAVPLMAIGTAMSVGSSIMQGQAGKEAAEYNQRLADMQAEATRKAGLREQEQIRDEKRRTLAAQRAGYAAAGIKIDEGSPLEVLAETARQYDLDIQASKYNTRMGIARAQAESKYYGRAASSATTAGILSAGSSLLTGGYGIARYGGGSTKGDANA